MKRRIRVGAIGDQDRWRRDDLRACTPAQRVEMLLQMQADYCQGSDRKIERVIHVRKLGA